MHHLALPFELRLLVMKRASTHFAETLLPRLFAAAATAPPTPLQFFESCAASVFEFVSRAHHANPAVAARGWALICSERFEAKGISWEPCFLLAAPALPRPAPRPRRRPPMAQARRRHGETLQERVVMCASLHLHMRCPATVCTSRRCRPAPAPPPPPPIAAVRT